MCLPILSRFRNIHRPLMEACESRLFKSVSSWTSDSPTTVDNDEYATIEYGDNGYPYGMPTESAGQGTDEDVWSSTVWASDPDDGVYSGWRAFDFSVNSANDGNASLSVDDTDAQTFSVDPNAAIHSVTIQADAMYGGISFSWSDLTVSFYHNGQLVDTEQPANFSAGDLNSTSSDASESGVVVTTSDNANGVEVKGFAEIQSAAGVYPGGTDVFGQISIK
jgi:hypothetical protein